MGVVAHGNALPEGYRLLWYRIRRVLGHGGFGITYEALDTNLETPVAIKEYLPREFAVRENDSTVHPFTEDRKKMFEWGMDRFLQEARTLAKFHHHNIVRVHNVFQENGTAYMVMDYEQGESLDQLFKLGRLEHEKDLMRLLMPLLDGIEHMHEAGFIHRDIKPPNIYVRLDGSPVLLDFGSARFAIGGETKTLTSLVTPGFAPFEQYNPEGGKQGPWTDIYGLGATMYAGINRGRGPIEAIIRGTARLEGKPDPFEAASEKGKGRYSQIFLGAIDAALGFQPQDRPQSVSEWRKLFAAVKQQDTKPLTKVSSQTETPTFIRGGERVATAAKGRGVAAWIVSMVVISLLVVGTYLLDLWRPVQPPELMPAPVPGQAAIGTAQREQQVIEQALQRQQEAAQQAQLTKAEAAIKQREEQARLQQAEATKQLQLEQERAAVRLAEERARLEQERVRLQAAQEAREKVQRIDELLTRAETALAATRLTSPAGDNAMEYLQAVLAIDAGNIKARQGIGRVVSRYIELAEAAVDGRQWDSASKYLAKAESIEPGTEAVTLMRRKLEHEQQIYKQQLSKKTRAQPAAKQQAGGTDVIVEQALPGKLPIGLAVYGVTKRGSVQEVSGRMRASFSRGYADQVDIKTVAVDKSYFDEKLSYRKNTEMCESNSVSLVMGMYFDHWRGGLTGEFTITAFDCASGNYTKKTFAVEYDLDKNSWSKSMKSAMKKFIAKSNVLGEANKVKAVGTPVNRSAVMSRAEIIAAFSGKTAKGVHVKNNFSFLRYFAPDGTLYEKSSNKGYRKGKWEAQDGVLCQEFEKYKCRTVTRDGGVIKKYDPEGQVTVLHNEFTDGKTF